MSTASPVECSETLPSVVRSECPHFSAETVGFRPDTARNSSVASTRLVDLPGLDVLAPARVDVDVGVGEHLLLQLFL